MQHTRKASEQQTLLGNELFTSRADLDVKMFVSEAAVDSATSKVGRSELNGVVEVLH